MLLCNESTGGRLDKDVPASLIILEQRSAKSGALEFRTPQYIGVSPGLIAGTLGILPLQKPFILAPWSTKGRVTALHTSGPE